MANFRSGLFNFGRSDIARALALSLVLHALLLSQSAPWGSGVWSQRGFAAGGSAIDANLRGMIAAPVVTPAVAARSPVAAAQPSPGKPLPSAALQREQASPAIASAHIARSQTDTAVERFPARDEALPMAGAVAAPARAPAPSDGEAVDAGDLRQYRLSLAIESRRFKRFPQEALEQRWSGTAQVRIAIAASGAPQSVQLLNSSGHEVLDAAALEMTHKAALNAVVPASLHGRPFSVPVLVEFRRDPE